MGNTSETPSTAANPKGTISSIPTDLYNGFSSSQSTQGPPPIQQQQQVQQYLPSVSDTAAADTALSSANQEKRARKKKTGKRLQSNETTIIPQSRMVSNVEIDGDINEQQFLESVQSAYGANARVELRSNKCNESTQRQQIAYQVVFDNAQEAAQAYKQSSVLQQRVASNLGIKGSAMAFDKPAAPRSIDGITLQLDSDTSAILCGACLVYGAHDECLKVVHYSDRDYSDVIKHSGDTQVHGKSVHTIKLALSDLDDTVQQLFFTLCACGPSDLSAFTEPVISLYEENEADINLIQYPIEAAGKSRSVVMCRLFRSDGEWSIQALGSQEWHIEQKVCMAYQHAKGLIDAHLKASKNK